VHGLDESARRSSMGACRQGGTPQPSRSRATARRAWSRSASKTPSSNTTTSCTAPCTCWGRRVQGLHGAGGRHQHRRRLQAVARGGEVVTCAATYRSVGDRYPLAERLELRTWDRTTTRRIALRRGQPTGPRTHPPLRQRRWVAPRPRRVPILRVSPDGCDCRSPTNARDRG
jgi:hypothetical protein